MTDTRLQEDAVKLAELKDKASKLSKEHKEAKAEADEFERGVLQRMEIEDTQGFKVKSAGLNFSYVDKVKGYISDEDAFIQWALENDEGLAEFVSHWCEVDGVNYADDLLSELIPVLKYLSLVDLGPRQARINAMVRDHLDDGVPLPPGVAPLPVPYVSIRKA